MNRGAFDFVCKPVNFDDLEITLQKTMVHVAQIKETLKAIQENNILRMYVDENVLNFMNRSEFESTLMRNETIDASIAFIDICGFTSMTETQPADKVVKLLNKYFDVMVKEIIAQNGHVDKFIGDAIMAVFRGDYHLDRAIDACLAVRAQIDKAAGEANEIDFLPRVSIGVNSGELISGNIGSANLRRLDYTVIGDVVNTAQRLQAYARAGQIVITEACYNSVRESFKCEKMGDVMLRNKANAVTVYQVIE